jgi:hypothetical protein
VERNGEALFVHVRGGGRGERSDREALIVDDEKGRRSGGSTGRPILHALTRVLRKVTSLTD